MITELITNAYGDSAQIDSQCISIMFHRPTGTRAFNVQGITVPDGETLTISQNKGDIDQTKYQIVFAAGPEPRQCVVARIVPKNLQEYCGTK